MVEAVLEAEPENVRAHLCRVVVAVRGGRMQEAREWASRLLTLEPGFRAEHWCARECFGDPPASSGSPTTSGRRACEGGGRADSRPW